MTLEFRRADFVSCRHFVGRIPQKTALKGPGEPAEAQEQSIPTCRKLSRHGRRSAWLNGELLTVIKSERQVYSLGKQEGAALEEYRNAA